MKQFLFFFFLALQLAAKPIETFYGVIEVDEPVLLELIESAPVQRLKKVRQYGIAYYTSFKEEYTRYDHSLGVFAILRLKNRPLKEQIAGLLHDASHTAFSHVGDYLFKMAFEKDSFQDSIHEEYLKKCGLGKILEKHGFTIQDVLPKKGNFPALEKELPDLCADRIDYNLQGAFYRGMLSKAETKEVFDGLKFQERESEWIAEESDALKKMARFALFMTVHCWGSPQNYVESESLSKALLRAVDIKLISSEEIFYGTDDDLWKKLTGSEDPELRQWIQKTLHANQYFSLSQDAGSRIRLKFRGVDPKLRSGKRLTTADPVYAGEYLRTRQLMADGWPLKEMNK